MKFSLKTSLCKYWAGLVLLAGLSASCTDWIYEDRSGCEHGVWLNFRYDYNLHRTDMFKGQVGGVRVYVFDEQGEFLSCYDEPDVEAAADAAGEYRMYLDLPAGRYSFLALAGQCGYEEALAGKGAKFRIDEPAAGEPKEALSVTLDYELVQGGLASVPHGGYPLDTLWHGLSGEPVDVPADRYAYETVSLMRDTKYISVSLREVDRPAEMDADRYEFRITDDNLRLGYGADENVPTALYTPYVTWNTEDGATTAETRAQGSEAGRTAHADFMTSRLFSKKRAEENARLVVSERGTGREVISVDLIDLLGQLRNYDEIQRYSLQEFLDRGHDYRLTFFLKGGSWEYVNVSIGVLGWSKRVQNVNLGIE